MKLKNIKEVEEFRKVIHACAGAVYLKSQDGDVFNLKSALSEYIALGQLLSGGSFYEEKRRSTTPQSSEAVTGLNEERPLLSRWTRPKRSSDIQRSFLSGAGGGARTRTVVTPRDFKACIPYGRQRKYTELQVQDLLKINAFHRFLKK